MAPNPNFPRYPEYHAVVGPRRSGKTTIARAVAQKLARIHAPNAVLYVGDNGKDWLVQFTPSVDVFRRETDTYSWLPFTRPANHREDAYRAVVYDGFVPKFAPQVRIVSCSELNV